MRKPVKSPACRRIHKRRTIESEVEEVLPEVAKAAPWTRIDDLWAHLDRRYDNLMSHLRNFYWRSDELLRRVRRAEDGAEISLEEIFERRPDIVERWGPVMDGLCEVREMEEAEAAMDEEAEGSRDGESQNWGDEDEPAPLGVLPDGRGESPTQRGETPEGSGSAGSDGEKDVEGEKEEEHPKSRLGAWEASAPPIVTEPSGPEDGMEE
ncbi:hypothetical protein FB451DRAFT_1479886 [Mycena latifolia]|nr:hypothetical protein FB451DRAFT_1479886 [Mycena latifolia]